jgi:hypothetical protein
MKKWMTVSIVIGLVLALSACGSTQSANTAPTASTALSQEGQLLVGTIKLESTSLAVSATQAESLLPLWETLQSLASSGTSASQEVDAVVSQIQSTMSAEQISSIAAMNLTQQDLMAAVTNTGAASTSSSSAGTTNASSVQLQAGAGGPGAGAAGGGNPPTDMGGGMPASTGAQSQTDISLAVNSQSSGTTNRVSPSLINALVEILKTKIA